MREMINRVQNHRKKRGYEVHTHITLHILVTEQALLEALHAHKTTLEKESLATLTLHSSTQDFTKAIGTLSKQLPARTPLGQEEKVDELRPCVETILEYEAQIISYPAPQKTHT